MKKKIVAFLILALLLSACAKDTPPEEPKDAGSDLTSSTPVLATPADEDLEKTDSVDTISEPSLPSETEEGEAEQSTPVEGNSDEETVNANLKEEPLPDDVPAEPKNAETVEQAAPQESSTDKPTQSEEQQPAVEEAPQVKEDGTLVPSIEAFQGKWVNNWNTWNDGEYWEFCGNEFYYECYSTFWANPWDYDKNGNIINERFIDIYSLCVEIGTFDVVDEHLCLTILQRDYYTCYEVAAEVDLYNDNGTEYESVDFRDDPEVWSPRPITEITADHYITSEILYHERVTEHPTAPCVEWGFDDPYIAWQQ